MERIKILGWALVAFLFVLIGVNSAFEANIKMTGATDIAPPVAYQVQENQLELSFLGQEVLVCYSQEQLRQTAEQLQKNAGRLGRSFAKTLQAVILWANNFYQRVLEVNNTLFDFVQKWYI